MPEPFRRSTAGPARPPRWAGVAARALRLALPGGVLVYALHVLGVSPAPDAVYAVGLHSALLFGAAALCALRGLASGQERLPWAVFALGMLAWGAGSVAWDAVVAGDPDPSYPTLADLGWLLFYPAAYAGVVLLVRSRVRCFPASAWLDGLLGALAIAALVAAFVVAPVADATGGDRHAVLLALVYPVLDTVLLAICTGAAVIGGGRLGRDWWLICAGFVSFAVADSLYAYAVAAGTYDGDGLLNVTWPLGMTIIALAAWDSRAVTRPQITVEARADGMATLLLPLGFASAALFLLVFGNLHGISSLALWLAAGAVIAAFARAGLGFREALKLVETRRQAMTDELTGLGNRRLMQKEMGAAVERARASGGRVLFLLIDLDGFKEVNDTLGHQAGDSLLRRIGPRLRGALAPGQLLARLGGDEFGILLPHASDQSAIGMGHEVRLRLQEAFAVDGLSIALDASVGIAAFPDDAASPEELIQHADVAMYQAKATRTGVQRYEARRNPHSRDRLALLGGLRAALRRGEIVPHYQPKADLATGAIAGVEALARWHHRERGVLAPGVFLPHAEQSALMRTLTLGMLEQALADTVRWRREGSPLGVAVNLSVVNLIDERLPGDVQRCLADAGADPGWLELEITENVVMTDPERAIAVLAELRDIGVTIALDDYGTGQASLAWLKRLPLDVVKIDRSFVRDVATDLQSAAIVRSTVELARAFGLTTVAEGVEDAACLRRIGELGCDLVQGYVLARPLPAADVPAFLAARAIAEAGARRAPAPAIPLAHAAGPHGRRAHSAR